MDVRDAFIEVDCSTGPSWGRTNVDWRNREHFGDPNAKVGLDIDGDRFAELIVERISLPRMIVFAAIAPHGAPVFEDVEGPTRRGMEELGRRFAAARPEAAIVLTPHGVHVDGHFAVVRSAQLEGDASQWTPLETRYEGPGDPQLADACVAGPAGRRAAGGRDHVRRDRGRRVDDAARLGRADPALVHARPGGRRQPVPRALERRARPRRRCAGARDRRPPRSR